MSAAVSPGTFVVLPVDQLRAVLREELRAELRASREREEIARRPLTAKDCADRYTDGSLPKWRDLRHRWPSLDEKAALGPIGKGRRWDAERLAAAFAELKPQMRRRRSSSADQTA